MRRPDAVGIALALLVLATGWSEAVDGDGVLLGFGESPVAVAAVTVDTEESVCPLQYTLTMHTC